MLKNYINTAIRNLLANKLLSFVNITGLALGLACCLLILLYVKDDLSYDKFHKNGSCIYQLICDRIETDGRVEKFAIAAMVQGPAFKREIPEIEQFVRVCPKQAIIKKENENIIGDITWADEAFFSVFSFPLLSGDKAHALKDPLSVVLSENAAMKYFNTINAVGKTLQIEVNGIFKPFIVTGIASQAPENSSIKFSIILPFKYLEETNPDNGWMWVSYPTYFLLKQGAKIDAVISKMNKIYHVQAQEEINLNHQAGYGNTFVWSILPFAQVHLNTEYKGSFEASNPLYYKILSGIAFFILLIASINFVNLTIVNSLKRFKEIGIRKAIGSSRKQLAGQFLIESFLQIFAAFCAAIIIAWLALPVFNELSHKNIQLSHHFDLTFILLLALLLLFTGLLSGSYPAIILSSVKPVQALQDRNKRSPQSILVKAFVVIQFSLATSFIIVVWMMNVQFHFLTNTDLGYNEKNLLEFTIDKAIMNKDMMSFYKSEFSRVPGVESVGFCNVGKFGGKTIADQKELEASYCRIDEGYLSTMQIQLMSGRNFSNNYPSDSSGSVVVNQTFADQAGWTRSVGKTIEYMNIPGWGNKSMSVIGVVKDYHALSLKEKIRPMVFTMDGRLPLGKFVLRINPNNIRHTLVFFEKEYHTLIPEQPLQYAFKDDINRSAYEEDKRWKSILTCCACLAVIISCIGLFSISMLIAKGRSKEIAIRKVLGASAFSVLAMICSDFLKLVLAGLIIASPVSFIAIRKWLQDFAYRADVSWYLFVEAGSFVVGIALATTFYHAAKASLANPVESLQRE